MLVAGNPVHLILAVFSILVRTLYAATGGGVVAGNGQTDGRTVTEVNRLLHQSLSQRTASHNGA